MLIDEGSTEAFKEGYRAFYNELKNLYDEMMDEYRSEEYYDGITSAYEDALLELELTIQNWGDSDWDEEELIAY